MVYVLLALFWVGIAVAIITKSWALALGTIFVTMILPTIVVAFLLKGRKDSPQK